MSRLPPIPEEQLTEAQRRVVDEIASGPRGGVRGPFIPLLRSPELAARIARVGEVIRFGSVLPQHLVELAILVTSRAARAPFEWQAHYPLAIKAGLPTEAADQVGRGERPAGSDDVEAVYDYADQLMRHYAVTDATYQRLEALFGPQGAVELTAVCGYYTMLAMVLNVAGTAMPEGRTAPFPPASPG